MSFHNIKQAPAGATGDVTIEFTDANLTVTTDETTTNTNIAAGKFKVYIKNVGPTGGGSLATATVNGQDLFAGAEMVFEAFTDWTNKQTLKTPALAIVTNGATIWYQTTE